jgi:hypothetical protein
MKEFGIGAIEKLPSKTKRRRAFTFCDTIGNDKKLLRKILEEEFKDFLPNEIPIPKTIKNVNAFLHRWDLGMFYQEIINLIIVEELTEDIPIYVGDIDTVIPWHGHYLFIEQKSSEEKLSINQLRMYLSFAEKYDATVWYLIGDTPDEDNKNISINQYKLCVIEPSGRYRIYMANIKDIFCYFRQWLKECMACPKIGIETNKDLAEQIIADIEKGKYEDLSFEVAFNEYFCQQDS